MITIFAMAGLTTGIGSIFLYTKRMSVIKMDEHSVNKEIRISLLLSILSFLIAFIDPLIFIPFSYFGLMSGIGAVLFFVKKIELFDEKEYETYQKLIKDL